MRIKKQANQDKVASLRSSGTLNPSPESVRNAIFQNNIFFDPRDIVQVKYELLRRVQIEGVKVSNAVKEFGFSRLSYYRMQAIFKEFGLHGLMPQKRGPRQAHKLNADVLKFVNNQIENNSSISVLELKTAIERELKLTVHARTIERALKKKRPCS